MSNQVQLASSPDAIRGPSNPGLHPGYSMDQWLQRPADIRGEAESSTSPLIAIGACRLSLPW